jgi:uncharacterized protein (DUF58 family)
MVDLIPVLLGLFLMAALFRIDTYFSLVYLLAGAYVAGRLWSRQAIRQLRATRQMVNRAFSGEEIPVTLRVENDGWLPSPWVEMHDALPVALASPPFYRRVLSLRPHEVRRFSYSLKGHSRGYYAIGPMIWRTGDLLGLAPQQAGRHESEHVIIYPRVLPLDRLGLPTRSPLASLPAPAALFEDPTRVVGMRAYQRGDSPRRIHWSASASAGALLVKRYQPAIARETLICLDLAQGNYSFQRMHAASELAIVTAASVANHIIVHEGLAVGLTTQAFDPLAARARTFALPPGRQRAHLMGILEVLARVQTVSEAAPETAPETASEATPVSGEAAPDSPRRAPAEVAKDPEAERASGEPPPDPAPLPLPVFLRQQGHNLPWGSTVIVITGEQTTALDDALLYLRGQGLAVALILVMPPPPDTTVQRRAAALGMPVYTVWREEELTQL